MLKAQFINQTEEKSWNHYRYLIKEILKQADVLLNIKKAFECSIILVSADEIHRINKVYRNIDKVTDVISFASHDLLSIEVEESNLELGDIFINVTAIRNQAQDYHHSLKREFSFLVTHGLLHLLGYDHMTLEDEQKMFDLQEEILSEIAPRKHVK